MGFWGADVQQLTTLSQSMQSSGRRFEALEKSISAQLRATPWKGDDAVAFKALWEGGLRLQCRQAASFLDAAAQTVQRNAREQEQASQSAGGSGLTIKPLPIGHGPVPRILDPAQLKTLDDYRFSDWFDFLTDPNYQSAPSAFESIVQQVFGPRGTLAGSVEDRLSQLLDDLGIEDHEKSAKTLAAAFETALRDSALTGAAVLRGALRFMPVADVVIALADMGVGFNQQDPVSMANASVDLGLAVISTALELSGAGALFGLGVDVLGLVNDLSFMIFPDGIPFAIYDALADSIPEIRELIGEGQDLVEEHVDPVVADVVEQIEDLFDPAKI